MYEKIKKFFTGVFSWVRKNFSWVVAGLVFIGGFFVGRKSVPSIESGIEQLKSDNKLLREYAEQLRGQLVSLKQLHGLSTEQCTNLEYQLRVTRKTLDAERSNLEQGRSDLEQLRESNQHVRAILDRYRKQLEKIEVI